MKSTVGPVSSLLLGVAFLIVGHGLQLIVVPLRASAEGWSQVEIGAIGSAYYIGFVAGCLGGPYVILRAGHIRAFAAAVSLAAASVVAHPLWVAFPVWFVLRLAIGASLACLYLIIESWLNDRVNNASRGLIMSAYIIVNFAALTIGQFVATLASPTVFTLFAVATLSMSLATIPVALTRSAQPAPVTLVNFRPLALYKVSPVGIVGVTMIGVANGAFWSLGAVAVVGTGLTTRDAALFMSIATVGGALMQWPVGRLSDRVDRRAVLMALLAGAALVGLLLVVLPASRDTWFALAFLFGLTTLPTYSIAAAHAYDHAEPRHVCGNRCRHPPRQRLRIDRRAVARLAADTANRDDHALPVHRRRAGRACRVRVHPARTTGGTGDRRQDRLRSRRYRAGRRRHFSRGTEP